MENASGDLYPLNMGSKAFAFSSCSLESPKFFRASQFTLSGSITYFFVRLLRCLCRCFLLRLLYLLLCLVRLFVLHFLFLCFGCRMVEVVLDYRCNLGKFNFRNFEEVETGRFFNWFIMLEKKLEQKIAVTVEFSEVRCFSPAVRFWSSPFSSTPFTALIVFFSLSSTRRISTICSSVVDWLAVFTSITF